MRLRIKNLNIGGFQKRLLGTVMLSLLVVIVIFTAFFYYQSSFLLKREFIEKGKALGKNFSFNSLTGIKTGDMSLLYPALLGLAEQEDVMLVGIYGTDGSVLITHAKEEGIDTVLSKDIIEKIGIGETVLSHVGDSYDFLFPVKEGFLDEGLIDAFEEETVGIVRITLSTQPMNNALARTTRILVFFGIIILVMGGFLAVVMARAIAGPIGSISEKMEEIGSGKADLTKRLSIPGHDDELGRLAKGFNNFVDALSRITKEFTHAAPELLEQAQGLASVSEELTASSEEITGALQEIAEASV
ncbi:MAG: methyl-accepting chemotaxis protein, partial [candidate division WOR-3 bacterium]